MSHIPASYDHFWWFSISVKIDNFLWISQKSHFRWFSKSWHCRGKTIKTREIDFLQNFISRMLHLVPETVKFWFLGHTHGWNTFFITLKSEISDFRGVFLSKLIKEKSSKNRNFWLWSIGKSILTMHMTQKPKFHRLRNQMSISRKKFARKNNFPKRLCFPSGMSWFCKFTKMGFPEIPGKMVKLHNYIKSWEMVARGWYTAHFNRTDILNTKKISLDGFCHLSNFSGPICEISRFFH